MRFEKPNQNPQENEYNPARLGSQLGKFQTKIRPPQGAEWAKELVSIVPDAHKPLIMKFIESLPKGKRVEAAEKLTKAVEEMADQIRASYRPDVEIEYCIDSVRQQLEAAKEKEAA